MKRLALFAILLFFAPSAALACQCYYAPDEEMIAEADYIFEGVAHVGTCVRPDFMEIPTALAYSLCSDEEGMTTLFTVTDGWKGVASGVIAVNHTVSTMCDRGFGAGGTYIVFAEYSPRKNMAITDMCLTPPGYTVDELRAMLDQYRAQQTQSTDQ